MHTSTAYDIALSAQGTAAPANSHSNTNWYRYGTRRSETFLKAVDLQRLEG
jgi:hypothetical protein